MAIRALEKVPSLKMSEWREEKRRKKERDGSIMSPSMKSIKLH